MTPAPPAPEPVPTVTLYGRPGCSLCDQAAEILAPLATRLGFRVQPVNIETDDALLERFMFEIPVIALGERVLAKAPVRAGFLEDALVEALAANR